MRPLKFLLPFSSKIYNPLCTLDHTGFSKDYPENSYLSLFDSKGTMKFQESVCKNLLVLCGRYFVLCYLSQKNVVTLLLRVLSLTCINSNVLTARVDISPFPTVLLAKLKICIAFKMRYCFSVLRDLAQSLRSPELILKVKVAKLMKVFRVQSQRPWR